MSPANTVKSCSKYYAKTLPLLTDDQDFIGKARQYGLLDAGDDVVGAVFDGEYVHNYCNRDEDDEELTAEENE